MIQAKKKIFDSFISDKDKVDKMNRLMSASYMLLSLNQLYIDELKELFDDNGMCLGTVKHNVLEINKNFDQLHSHLKHCMDKDMKLVMIEDFEKLQKILVDFFKE